MKARLKQVKAQLEQDRIFNTASSFKWFWKTKLLWIYKFSCVYSINNLSKIKHGAYVSNFEFISIESHWIALYVKGNNTIYFDSFGVEHILKEIRKFIGNKNIIAGIHRIWAYDSIIYRYFCIRFIDFMLKAKSLLDSINFFSPNEYEKNDKIILKNFQ